MLLEWHHCHRTVFLPANVIYARVPLLTITPFVSITPMVSSRESWRTRIWEKAKHASGTPTDIVDDRSRTD